jgi:hypothetical protein
VSRAGIALRVALLPMVMLVGVVLYGQAVIVATKLMPLPEAGPLTIAVRVSQGFLAATLNAAVACYPLARLYGRAATGVAALVALPVAAAALQGSGGETDAMALLLRGWALLCFVVLLMGGTWLVARRRQADDSAR